MQKALLFTLPPAIDAVQRVSASGWRDAFEAAGIGRRADWDAIRVLAIKDQLSLYAGTPDANRFLDEHLDAIAGCIADQVNAPCELHCTERQVGVRAGTETLWAYRIPRLVVEKKHGDWQPHFEALLSPDLKERILRRIEASLRRELNAWGRLPEALEDGQHFLALADPGRAIIVPAIEAGRSGGGKPVNVLLRKDVVVMCYWRFEGHLFVGPLASLGYGRVARGTPPEVLSTQLQRDLLKIMPDAMETI